MTCKWQTLILLLAIILAACTAQHTASARRSRPARTRREPRQRMRQDNLMARRSRTRGRSMPNSTTSAPVVIDRAPLVSRPASAPIPGPPPSSSPVAPPSDAPTPQPADEMMPPEEGDLRLVRLREVNGYTIGALQIFLDGDFGSVCAVLFTDASADVACRQMGFKGGGFLPQANQGLSDAELKAAEAPVVLENVDCTGSEDRLLDCPLTDADPYANGDYTPRILSCDPSLRTVSTFIACGSDSGPGDGEIRLAAGATSEDGLSQYGRLEYANAGGWGTVCDRRRNNFGRPFSTENVQDVDDPDVFLLPVWISAPDCAGNETALPDCPGGINTSSNFPSVCAARDTVELACTTPNPELDGRLRLMDGASGPGYEYGRLEIFIRGFWSAVCDKKGFTPESAGVACRSLGFDGGAVLQFIQPYGFVLSRLENEVLVKAIPPGISAVDCNGTETSLLECTSSEDFQIQGECSVFGGPETDATVLACGTMATGCDKEPVAEQGAVRLVGGFGTPCDPLHSGIVEVFNAGEWGASCDGDRSRHSNPLVANVVCRQLGFRHGTVVDSLTAIPERFFDYFNYIDEEQIEESQEPQGRFWLDNVQCRGPEQRLVDCDLGAGFLSADAAEICDFADDSPPRLQVACRQFAVPEALEEVVSPGAEEGDLRLQGLTSVANWEVGRLEMFFEGSWGQVCGEGFFGPDASVACRQLGYTAAGTQTWGLVPIDDPNTGLVAPEVALTAPGCAGDEATLLECLSAEGNNSRSIAGGCRISELLTITSRLTPGLRLACVASEEKGQEGGLRLVERREEAGVTSGILEIFHAGAWGTFCDFFDNSEYSGWLRTARVACRQLGLPTAGARFVVERTNAGIMRNPPWLYPPMCQGSEGKLSHCGDLQFGNINRSCDPFLRLACGRAESS